MARNNHIINSFIAGEVSPRFFGRTDAGQYNQSLEDGQNFIVYPQGGGTKRPGTYYVHDCKRDDGTYPQQARLIPFYGADGKRYQLLITSDSPDKVGDEYFWKAIDLSDNSVTPIHYRMSFAEWDNYYALEEKSIDLNELQYAQIGDILFIVHPDLRPMKITYQPSLLDGLGYQFQMQPYPTAFPKTSGGEWLSPTDTFREMPFLDKGIVPVLDPTQIVSFYTLELLAGGQEANYVQINRTSLSVGDPFDETWIGRHIKFSDAGKTIVVQITDISPDDPNYCRAIVLGGAKDTDPQEYDGTMMEFGYWDEVLGYPRAVCAFESRLVFAGNEGFPDTIWFSQINDIAEFMQRKLEQDPDFSDPVSASDTFLTTLRSNILNQIQWLSDGKTITAGTNYREFVVQGPNPQQSIGQSNIQTNAETPYGSAYVQAARIDNTVAFLQRHRSVIREMVYNLDENSFKAANLNIIGAHMAQKSTLSGEMDALAADKGIFIQMSMQQVPIPVLWCIDSQGRLVGLTREREQNVVAWHSHRLGGDAFLDLLELEDEDAFEYQPRVKSVSVIQRPRSESTNDGEPDELWMVVSRGVKKVEEDGFKEVLFIERMGQEWEGPTIEDNWNVEDDVKDVPNYMDCALVYSSENDDPTTITGLQHIYGIDQIVDVVVNGRYGGQKTVSASGTIDISDLIYEDDDGEWNAIIGYNYGGYLVPVTPDTPAQLGSSMGQPRRIDQIVIHFYRTIGAKFGKISNMDELQTPIDEMEEILFKEGVDQASPTPMYTGDKRLDFNLGYETRPKIKVESHLPFPCTVTHIVARQVVYE